MAKPYFSKKVRATLEYVLHDANVATREFALCMGGYCLEIKPRQMFEGTIFFYIRKQNHKKTTNISNFLRFLGGKELKEDYLEQLHALN